MKKEMNELLYNYSYGKYDDICEYSQYIISDGEDVVSKRSGNEMVASDWEILRLPEISDEIKQQVIELADIIDNQSVSSQPLYRIERGVTDVKTGDVINIGIRSTSQDSDFINRVFSEEDQGMHYYPDGNFTEYRFLNSKSLDISDISAFQGDDFYKGQEESLVFGTYRVVKTEAIENIHEHIEEVSIPFKDYLKNKGIDVELGISKKGNEIVRYYENDVLKTMSIEQYNTKKHTDYFNIPAQYGRKVVYLEYVKEPDRKIVEGRSEYNGESESSIKEYVQAIVKEAFDELNTYDSEMNLKVEKIEIYGSRSKGYHTKESDLDVLVQYSGNMKEDALFNILHESKISLSGMTLDINPIRSIESGPIDLYHQKADNILDARMKNKKRLFVDIDGTLAHFEKVDTLERLYEKGYFENLAPQKGVIEAVKHIKETEPDVEVFILSSVLKDSKYALEEKNAWLDKYLPQIDRSHRLFPFCGESKADALEAVGGIRKHDFLLDDYTLNLNDWPVKENAILLLNGINHTHKSWQGNKIRFDKAPYLIASNILGIIKNKLVIQDERPQDIVAYSKQIKEMKENIEINPKL